MKLFSIWSVRSSCLNESRISSDKGKFWYQIARPLLMAGICSFASDSSQSPLFRSHAEDRTREAWPTGTRGVMGTSATRSPPTLPSAINSPLCLGLLVSGCITKRNHFSTVNLTSYFLYMVVLCIMRCWLSVRSRWLDIIIGKFFCAFLWNETKAIIVTISKKERAQ